MRPRQWDPATTIGFDIETSGELPEYALQPWRVKDRQAWMTTWAWTDPDGPVDGGHMPKAAEVRARAQRWVDQGLTVCAWNAAFEIAWLCAYGCEDLVHQIRWIDGMLLWRHLEVEPEWGTQRNKRRSFGLKDAVRKYRPDKAGYEEDIDFHDTSPAARAKLLEYNKDDAELTLDITRMLYEELAKDPRRLAVALIEAKSLSLVGDANYRGMNIDRVWCKHLAAELQAEAAQMLSELESHGVTEKVVRSPKQLATLLFDEWGLTPLKRSAAGNRSTDKETLHELSAVDDRVSKVRTYREALNNVKKFALNPLEAAEYSNDGRAHPLAKVFSTYTGRMTYSSDQGTGKERRQTGWALHQEKRDKKFRNILVAPPGYTICEFDAAGQEYRWMAVASGDLTMQALCQPGEDPHAFMAAQVVGGDYRHIQYGAKHDDEQADKDRKLGKVGNLCVAGDTMVLTDRGHVPIVEVTKQDRVWDGVEFVTHDGVVCSGTRPVLSYCGITATPDHQVLVDGRWERLDEAARHGWQIEPALGSGWAGKSRAGVRIVDGVVRRAVREVWGAVRASAVRLRCGAGRQPAVSGDRAQHPVQIMRNEGSTCRERAPDRDGRAYAPATEACQRLVPAVPQPSLGVLPQLRSAWDRVQVRIRGRGRRVHTGASAARHVSGSGHRPVGQRWALRAGQPATGDSTGESGQQAVYDIVNCGPRTRFAANGVIVHNSLQYRTSANKLRVVSRVQYGIPMDDPQAMNVHRTYRQTYTNVPRYWDFQITHARQVGFVQTLAGRQVQLPKVIKREHEWSVGSTAINYRIQGTGADQKYLAMAVLKSYMLDNGILFGFELHDGLYLYVPDEIVERVVPEVLRILDNLPYQLAWGFTPPVPLPWDAKVGKSWGTLKEWHDD